MFLSESVRVRQIGVVLFKARDFMDSLDGFVARASKKQVRRKNKDAKTYFKIGEKIELRNFEGIFRPHVERFDSSQGHLKGIGAYFWIFPLDFL